MKNNAPIGVFDSGLGGFTVLSAIQKELGNEDLIYFGDSARIPYGSKSGETVRAYSKQIFAFLKEYEAKFIVIACNTATAHSLKELQSLSEVPVIGVIQPAIEALFSKKSEPQAAVLATRSTIRSDAYMIAFENVSSKGRLQSLECPLFVPLIEEGYTDNSFTQEIIHHYINQLDENVTDIILGCTHYPLLKATMNELYPQLSLIDSSEVTAQTLRKELQNRNLLNSKNENGRLQIFVSDITENSKKLAKLFLGHTPELELVSLESLSELGKGLTG